jgi:nucleoside-triphosphatase THEP1
VFENEQRIGYDLIDLRHGSRRLLARVATSDDVTPTVGVFRFDDSAVAEGNAAICSAVRDDLEVIAIDEVGPLEFRGKGWAPALEFALLECGPQQELIIVARPSLTKGLPARFASPMWANATHVSPPWPSLSRK